MEGLNMLPFKIFIDVTNRYSLEIHGYDQDDAQTQAEKLSKHQIMDGGDFEEMVGVEVVDIEPLFQETDVDEEIVQEAIELDSLRDEPEEEIKVEENGR
jgi:hypothetical protein